MCVAQSVGGTLGVPR